MRIVRVHVKRRAPDKVSISDELGSPRLASFRGLLGFLRLPGFICSDLFSSAGSLFGPLAARQSKRLLCRMPGNLNKARLHTVHAMMPMLKARSVSACRRLHELVVDQC